MKKRAQSKTRTKETAVTSGGQVPDLPRGRSGASETEDWLAFKEACAQLDERSREAVRLKVEGHTNVEIGRQLELSPQRIGQILSVASKRLEELRQASNRPPIYDLWRWPKRGNQSYDWRRDDDWQPMEYLPIAGIAVDQLATLPEPIRGRLLENLKPFFVQAKVPHIWHLIVAAVNAAAKGEKLACPVDSADAEDLEDAA